MLPSQPWRTAFRRWCSASGGSKGTTTSTPSTTVGDGRGSGGRGGSGGVFFGDAAPDFEPQPVGSVSVALLHPSRRGGLTPPQPPQPQVKLNEASVKQPPPPPPPPPASFAAAFEQASARRATLPSPPVRRSIHGYSAPAEECVQSVRVRQANAMPPGRFLATVDESRIDTVWNVEQDVGWGGGSGGGATGGDLPGQRFVTVVSIGCEDEGGSVRSQRTVFVRKPPARLRQHELEKTIESTPDDSVAMFIKAQFEAVRRCSSKGGKHQKANQSAVRKTIEEVEDVVRAQGRSSSGGSGSVGDAVTDYERGLDCLGIRSLTTLLRFFCFTNETKKGEAVERVLVKKDMLDEMVLEARIRLSTKSGDIMGVVKLLVEGRRAGVQLRHVDFLFHAVAGAENLYSSFDLCVHFMRVLTEKQADGRPRAHVTLRGVRAALRTAGTYTEAAELLSLSPHQIRVAWPPELWAVWVRACRYDPRGALQVLAEMEACGLPLSARVVGAAMGVHNEARSFSGVVELFRRCLGSGVQADVVMMTEMVRACFYEAQRPGDEFVTTAEEAFSTALALGMEDDTYLWRSMMLVYGRVKDAHSADLLMAKYTSIGHPPCNYMHRFHRLAHGLRVEKEKLPEDMHRFKTRHRRLDPSVAESVAQTLEKFTLQMYKKEGHGENFDRNKETGAPG